jgi:type I restriction enzyme S subunit
MPKNWKTYKFSELFETASGLSKSRDQFGFGSPFLTFKDVFYNYFLPPELGDLANTSEKEQKRGSVKKGDIFLTRTSETLHELGMSSVALKDYPNATFNGFCKRLRQKKESTVKIHPEFIGYFLRSNSFRNEVSQHATMTTRASLNNTSISSLSVTLPLLAEQVEISKILKPLDDKIELNLQMNKTLEEMAMALYKHWFVDFGPFQNEEFIDSELGEIPKGWEVLPIDSIVKIFKKSFKPQDNPEVDFLHYSIPAFDKGKMPVEEKGLEMKSNKTLLNSDRILVSKLNPRFPRIWTVFYRKSEEIAVTSPEFINYEVRKSDDWSFANFLFRESGFYSKFHENATGSTGSRQRVQPSLTLQFLCPIPPADIRREFNQLVNPMLKQIDENLVENQTLTQIRDTLLPKLISGEVRVKDAEKTLSEVL